MKKRTHKIFALCSAAAAVFILLSALFIISLAFHSCTGENCEICCHIYSCCQNMEKLFSAWNLNYALFSFSLCTALIFNLQNIKPAHTLITMKIKLSC